jgi:hypothetical protein
MWIGNVLNHTRPHVEINQVKLGFWTLRTLWDKQGMWHYCVRDIRSSSNQQLGPAINFKISGIFKINHIRDIDILLFIIRTPYSSKLEVHGEILLTWCHINRGPNLFEYRTPLMHKSKVILDLMLTDEKIR